MTDTVRNLAGRDVLVRAADGAPVASEADALDLVGATFGTAVEVVAVAAAALDPAFFDLRTGLAGAVTQKFVNYRLHLVVYGDIGGAVAASGALADYVRESNRGRHVWFVGDLEELSRRLA